MEVLNFKIWEHNWGVCLLYIFIAGIVLYPASMNLFSVIVGHEQATAGCHVWVLWWAQQGLEDIQSDLIFFPYGGDVMKLYGSDVLSPVLLSWIPISPIFLYNLWVWFLLVIGSMGVRALSLWEKSSFIGSFVGGIVFICAPFLLHELLNGTSEIVACAFLPWFLLFLKKSYWQSSFSNTVLLGFFAGICLLSSVYNAFFMLLLTMFFLIGRAITQREQVISKEIFLRFALSIVFFLPFGCFVGWLQMSHGAKETASRREDFMSKGDILPDSFASLDDWFDPSAVELPTMMPLPDGSSFAYWTLCTVYLGWIAMVLALHSLKKNRDMYFWCGLFAALLAMGPYLRIGGALIGEGISLPLNSLAYLFPLISIVALHAYRFAAVVVLCIAVCVSRSAQHSAWGLCILLEALFFSPVPYPTSVMKGTDSIALEQLRLAPKGAVVSAPLAIENLHDLSQALVAQTKHQKSIQDGGIHRRIGADATKLFSENVLVSAMSHRAGPVRIEGPALDSAIVELCTLGYRYFLLKRGELEMEEWAENHFGGAKTKDEQWMWWSFPHCEDKGNR